MIAAGAIMAWAVTTSEILRRGSRTLAQASLYTAGVGRRACVDVLASARDD
jgi:hypothetical protein